MLTMKKAMAAAAATATLGAGVVIGADTSDTTTAATAATQTTTAMTSPDGSPAGGPGGGMSAASVTTEEDLVALVQEAYGDASLGLHRGHQPVERILDEVLGISHDELHVRMESQGQNLATIAEDVGVDPQTLIDAMVDSSSPAIDGQEATPTATPVN